MSTTFTLDDINKAAEARYGSMDIVLDESSTLKLRNPLRLSKAERTELTAFSDKEAEDAEGGEKAEESEEQTLERMRGIIRIAADKKGLADRLFEHIGEDVALLVTIVEQYLEGTRAGEASPSQD